jgi:hypothetical protein
MEGQLHKRFSDEELRKVFTRYENGQVDVSYVLALLDIKRRRFFQLLKMFRENPEEFTARREKKTINRKINLEVEEHLLHELHQEHLLIQDPQVPIQDFNYSYIRDELMRRYNEKVSLPTVINRAKKEGLYRQKKKRTAHDREVLTHYAGELIQHDSSHHKFAPHADAKWYLISSLDDHSRFLLYAYLVERETTWTHILALKDVAVIYGVGHAYYVDSHSIFRFVQGRDSLRYKHNLFTDDTDPQWKQVARDLGIQVTYALSPQAKGKIERPYRWLQDRLVRRCFREGIKDISDARQLLTQEVQRYNYHQVHSTTNEIPFLRFEKALQEGRTFFRDLSIPPGRTLDDIFCLRMRRVVDAYHNISLNNLKFRIHKAPLREEVNIHIIPHPQEDMADLRIWYRDILTDQYTVKASDLVHF